MTRVAVTGLSGVIGSKLLPIVQRLDVKLTELYHFSPAMASADALQVDLSSAKSVKKVLKSLETDIIIHMAAATHIDYCEQDRNNGKDGFVWQTNVESTRLFSEYCQDHDTRLIFLSTECVFDGEKSYYRETVKSSPKNWYGETKAAAEEYVQTLNSSGTIIRAAITYHPSDQHKTIYGKIQNSFVKNKPFLAVSDQHVTFTHTPDIVRAIVAVLQQPKLSGIFHVSTNEELSPYEFTQIVAQKYGYDKKMVQPITMEKYFGKERAALRLRHASLSGIATQKVLGFKPQTLAEVLL